MADFELATYEDIYSEIKEALLTSRSQAYTAVNFTMVQAYWQIGRIIVEHEQEGNLRSGYGKSVLQELSNRLTKEFGKGFSVRTLQQIKNRLRLFNSPLPLNLEGWGFLFPLFSGIIVL